MFRFSGTGARELFVQYEPEITFLDLSLVILPSEGSITGSHFSSRMAVSSYHFAIYG